MKRAFAASTVLLVCLLWASPAAAIPITYDFEDFADSTDVAALTAPLGTTLTVGGATVASAGISLNDIDYPPLSGLNAVYNSGDAVTIGFSTAVNSLSAFFTYLAPVTLTAYFNGAAIGSVTGAFDANYVSSGNNPNEFLELAGLGVFNSVTIATGFGAGSFVFDNLTVDVPDSSNVPEPGTLSLMALGGVALLRRRRK